MLTKPSNRGIGLGRGLKSASHKIGHVADGRLALRSHGAGETGALVASATNSFPSFCFLDHDHLGLARIPLLYVAERARDAVFVTARLELESARSDVQHQGSNMNIPAGAPGAGAGVAASVSGVKRGTSRFCSAGVRASRRSDASVAAATSGGGSTSAGLASGSAAGSAAAVPS